MSIPTVRETSLPLELIRRGKVREIYQVDEQHLLMVTSDRISAFDVVMEEPVPFKGAVLTQLSAFWFSELRTLTPSHFISADVNDIVARVPQVSGAIEELRGRSMLVRRTDPLPFECVVRGYISGSAWAEYRQKGTLAGEPLPEGLVESQQLKPPIFSPATKAETGHDENVTFGRVREDLGEDLARKLRELSLRLYQAGRDLAAARDLIIADTKFEFGTTESGELLLIDEVLTPDSSRFWPSDEYEPGRAQRSFDKQPLRDHLAELKGKGRWNGDPPPPPLPSEVVNSTSERYLDAYRRITGTELLENL